MAIQLFFSCLFGDASYFLSETPCPNRSSRKTAIRSSPCTPQLSHPPNFPWKATANTQIIQSSKRFFFFLAFEDTPPSISPQLPLKHNRCLPTRLPSTSCLVTTSPLLSTTERLANSMSELNLETPLIYPPHWIDRSWLHRRSLSRAVACLISTLGSVFLMLKSKAASYYKQYSPIKSVPGWKKWFIPVTCRLVLLITTNHMLLLLIER